MSKWTQLLLVIGAFFITSAHAQNKPLACQGDAAAGLKWENGSWNTRAFSTEKFILVLKGSNLDEESVAKVLLSYDVTHCQTVFERRIACFTELGGFLFFDPSTMKGARSFHFGGTSNSGTRDALGIEAFKCQPF